MNHSTHGCSIKIIRHPNHRTCRHERKPIKHAKSPELPTTSRLEQISRQRILMETWK